MTARELWVVLVNDHPVAVYERRDEACNWASQAASYRCTASIAVSHDVRVLPYVAEAELEKTEVEVANRAVDAVCDVLSLILDTGEKHGVFGGVKLERLAQRLCAIAHVEPLINSHRREESCASLGKTPGPEIPGEAPKQESLLTEQPRPAPLAPSAIHGAAATITAGMWVLHVPTCHVVRVMRVDEGSALVVYYRGTFRARVCDLEAYDLDVAKV